MAVISFGLVFVQRMTGAGGVIQYSPTLFKMSGSTIDPGTACIIVGTFQLVASGVSFLLIDKVGRRTLLLISSAVITMCLVLLIFYFSIIENGEYNLLYCYWFVSKYILLIDVASIILLSKTSRWIRNQNHMILYDCYKIVIWLYYNILNLYEHFMFKSSSAVNSIVD